MGLVGDHQQREAKKRKEVQQRVLSIQMKDTANSPLMVNEKADSEFMKMQESNIVVTDINQADAESKFFKDGSKGDESVGVPFSRGGESSQGGRKFGTFTRSIWGRKTG